MKKVSVITVLGLFLLSFASFGQDANQQMPPEMKAWMDYMTPSEMHKLLAKGVGEWKTKITMWLAPDAPPTTAEGTSVCEMILGGRYLQSKHSSNFNGMPME